MAKDKTLVFEAPIDEEIARGADSKAEEDDLLTTKGNVEIARGADSKDDLLTTKGNEEIALGADSKDEEDDLLTTKGNEEIARGTDSKTEEDDLLATKGNEAKPFLSTMEALSFRYDSFVGLHLCRPLLRACQAMGYKKLTPIQAACIRNSLQGRDICGSALSGSEKIAAFVVPTLERLSYKQKDSQPAIRCLILTPTSELAVQVHSTIQKLAQFMTDIRCLLIEGISSKSQDVEAALRTQPDIVVATPGCLKDHLLDSISVRLDELAILILDEADRLLELGFSNEIRQLVALYPKRRQTMLFSAAMTEGVDELIKLSLNKPLQLSADPSTEGPTTFTEEVVHIRQTHEGNQEAVLLALCSKTFTSQVIIFSGTKFEAHRLKVLFGLVGLKAAELHGNLTQAQIFDALDAFRKQEVDFLLATDVAARGLDITGAQTVINFECPRDLTSYVRRVGLTARAGRAGYAVTFFTDNDRNLLKAISKQIGPNLKIRTVAEQSIKKWSKKIEQLVEQVGSILPGERGEIALMRAEMEAIKLV